MLIVIFLMLIGNFLIILFVKGKASFWQSTIATLDHTVSIIQVWGHNWSHCSWVFPNTISALYEMWPRGVRKKRAKTIWNFAFFSTIWIIWKERNNWCFEGLEFSSGVTCWKADLYHCFLDSCYPGFLWLSSDHQAFKLEGICYSLHVFLLLCLLSPFLLFSYKYSFLVLLRFCFNENYHLKKKVIYGEEVHQVDYLDPLLDTSSSLNLCWYKLQIIIDHSFLILLL